MGEVVHQTSKYAQKQLLNKLPAHPDQEYVDSISEKFLDIYIISYLLGRKKVYNKICNDYGNRQVSFSQDNISIRPKLAIKDLKKQLQLGQGEIYKTTMDSIRKSRIIAVLSYVDFVKKVNKNILSSLESGGSIGQFLKKMKEVQLKELVDLSGYWETVFTTNIATAYNAGVMQEMQRLNKYIAYERWTVVIGEWDACRKLDGQIREKKGFKYYPPLHYNCTSEVEPVSLVEAQRNKIKPTSNPLDPKPQEGFYLSPVRRFGRLPRHVIDRIPNTIPKNVLEGENKNHKLYLLNKNSKSLTDLSRIASSIIEGKVKYSGIETEVAKEINYALLELKSKFNIPWVGIKTKHMKQHIGATNQTLLLRDDTVENRLFLNKKIFQNIKKTQSFLKKNKNFFEARSIKDVIIHELAHALSYQDIERFKYTISIRNKKVKERDRSQYSTVNYAEYIAESFVAKYKGKEISKKAQEIFKKLKINI